MAGYSKKRILPVLMILFSPFFLLCGCGVKEGFGGPDLIYDNFIYVANHDDDSVSILKFINKTGTLKKLSSISVDSGPTALLVSADNKWIFLLSETTGTLTSYKPSSGTGNLDVISKVSVGKTPRFMIFSPIQNIIYVASRGSDSISVVSYDGSSGALTVVQTLSLVTNTLPYSLAIDENGKKLYSVDWGPGLLGNVSSYSIDSSSGTISLVSQKEVGTFPTAVQVVKGTNYLLVSNYGENTLLTLQKNNDTGVVQNLSSVTVGSGPSFITMDASNKKVFVLSSNDNTVVPCSLSDSGVVSCSSSSPTGITPAFATFDASGTFFFVANSGSSNNVSIFSFSSADGILTSIGSQATDASPRSLGIVKMLSPR